VVNYEVVNVQEGLLVQAKVQQFSAFSVRAHRQTARGPLGHQLDLVQNLFANQLCVLLDLLCYLVVEVLQGHSGKQTSQTMHLGPVLVDWLLVVGAVEDVIKLV